MLYTISTIETERNIMVWEIRNTETGDIVTSEGCPGNAAEHCMILNEIKGEGTFKVVEVTDAEPGLVRMMAKALVDG